MLPPEGTYRAKLVAGQQPVINEAQSGALCLYLAVAIAGQDWQWNGKHTMTLIKSDGTPQTKTIDTLKKVFGWDGNDPFWLTEQDFSEVEFDIVGAHEQYTPAATEENPEPEPRMNFKIKWLNPVGEGGGMNMPEQADRKAILAKYGSKFRALAGGTSKTTQKPAATAKAPTPTQTELPAGKPAAAPAKPASGPTSKSKSGGPPTKKAPPTAGGQAPTATLEEAWKSLCDLSEGKSEEEVGTVWYSELEAQFPGKSQDDLSIQEWGAFKAHLETKFAS